MRGRSPISPRRRERPVRIVAIRAHHDAFVDAVLERHGELRSNVGMAAVAQFRLASPASRNFGAGDLWIEWQLVHTTSFSRVRRAPDVGA